LGLGAGRPDAGRRRGRRGRVAAPHRRVQRRSRPRAPPAGVSDGGHYTRPVVETLALSGEELTVDDVWAVAVERAPAVLAESAHGKMRAARELVERAAHGASEH